MEFDQGQAAAGTGAPAPAGWSPAGPAHGWPSRFFGVIAHGRTWLNAAYLFVSFPLGLIYFMVLVVGTAVGVSLVILWVGIPVLLVVMAAWWGFAALERRLADALLDTDCGPSPRPWEREENPLGRMKAALSHPATWKGLAFTLIKFPLGVLSFCLIVCLTAFVDSLLFAPVWAALPLRASSPEIFGWHPHPWYLALVLVPAGVIVLFLGLHVINGVAAVWRVLVEALLVEKPAAPAFRAPATQPAAPQWPEAPAGWGTPPPWPQTGQPSLQRWPAPVQQQPPAQPPPTPPAEATRPGPAPVPNLDTAVTSPGEGWPPPASPPDNKEEPS